MIYRFLNKRCSWWFCFRWSNLNYITRLHLCFWPQVTSRTNDSNQLISTTRYEQRRNDLLFFCCPGRRVWLNLLPYMSSKLINCGINSGGKAKERGEETEAISKWIQPINDSYKNLHDLEVPEVKIGSSHEGTWSPGLVGRTSPSVCTILNLNNHHE